MTSEPTATKVHNMNYDDDQPTADELARDDREYRRALRARKRAYVLDEDGYAWELSRSASNPSDPF